MSKRINISPSHENRIKISKLAGVLDTNKATLVNEIVDTMLNNPYFINYIQDKYKVNKHDRLIPIVNNNKVSF